VPEPDLMGFKDCDVVTVGGDVEEKEETWTV
jgi:hypothetical protein